MRTYHVYVYHTCMVMFNFSIHWNFNHGTWFTAWRASWIYEQTGQTPTHNAPDDTGMRKGLEETTDHKDVINTSSQAQPCDPTGNYSKVSLSTFPISYSTSRIFRMNVQCLMSHSEINNITKLRALAESWHIILRQCLMT